MDQHTINTFSLSHYSLLNCQITFPSITSKRLATDVFFSIKMPQITFTYHYRNFGTLFGVKSSTHIENKIPHFAFHFVQNRFPPKIMEIHKFCGIWCSNCRWLHSATPIFTCLCSSISRIFLKDTDTSTRTGWPKIDTFLGFFLHFSW